MIKLLPLHIKVLLGLCLAVFCISVLNYYFPLVQLVNNENSFEVEEDEYGYYHPYDYGSGYEDEESAETISYNINDLDLNFVYKDIWDYTENLPDKLDTKFKHVYFALKRSNPSCYIVFGLPEESFYDKFRETSFGTTTVREDTYYKAIYAGHRVLPVFDIVERYFDNELEEELEDSYVKFILPPKINAVAAVIAGSRYGIDGEASECVDQFMSYLADSSYISQIPIPASTDGVLHINQNYLFRVDANGNGEVITQFSTSMWPYYQVEDSLLYYINSAGELTRYNPLDKTNLTINLPFVKADSTTHKLKSFIVDGQKVIYLTGQESDHAFEKSQLNVFDMRTQKSEVILLDTDIWRFAAYDRDRDLLYASEFGNGDTDDLLEIDLIDKTKNIISYKRARDGTLLDDDSRNTFVRINLIMSTYGIKQTNTLQLKQGKLESLPDQVSDHGEEARIRYLNN